MPSWAQNMPKLLSQWTMAQPQIPWGSLQHFAVTKTHFCWLITTSSMMHDVDWGIWAL